jgi:hypothetical protein
VISAIKLFIYLGLLKTVDFVTVEILAVLLC